MFHQPSTIRAIEGEDPVILAMLQHGPVEKFHVSFALLDPLDSRLLFPQDFILFPLLFYISWELSLLGYEGICSPFQDDLLLNISHVFFKSSLFPMDIVEIQSVPFFNFFLLILSSLVGNFPLGCDQSP